MTCATCFSACSLLDMEYNTEGEYFEKLTEANLLLGQHIYYFEAIIYFLFLNSACL